MRSLDNEGGLTSAILDEKLDFIEKNDELIKKSIPLIEITLAPVAFKKEETEKIALTLGRWTVLVMCKYFVFRIIVFQIR